MRRLTCAVLLGLLPLATLSWAAADPLDPASAPTAVRRAVFRAEAAYGRDDPAEAVDILSKALAAGDDRDHPALRYRLGTYLLELGRHTEALEHLRRASQQAEHSEAVWGDYARAAYEIGDHETAARAFAKAYQVQTHDAPDPTLLYYSAVSWILAEHHAEAVDVLVPLIEAASDTVPRDWVRALVSAAASCNQSSRADGPVERLLHDHPDAPDTWILASQQSQLRDDLSSAATRLQVADWLSPLSSRDIRRLADLYGAAGVPRQAARNHTRLWPADPRLARPLAVAWLQAHEPDSARVVLHAALEAESDVALWTMLGDLEYETEHWEEARRVYARATAMDPEADRAWLMQGVCGLKLDDHAAARQALERAVELDAVAADARRLLRHLESLASDPDEPAVR